MAVFFPIAFVEGIAGQIFKDQALTVVFSLLTSLAVALFFIPMLASRRFGGAASKGFRHFRFTAFSRQTAVLENSRWLISGITKGILMLPVYFLHQGLEIIGCLLYYGGFAAFWITARLLGLALIIFKAILWPVTFLFDRFFRLLIVIYPPLLRGVLASPTAVVLVLGGAAALCVYSTFFLSGLGQEVIPEVHQGELIARVGLHVGAPLEQTARVVERVEEGTLGVPGVDWVSSTIGIARDEISSAEEGEHTARIYIKLKGKGDIEALEEGVLRKLRKVYSGFPEIASVQFSRPSLFNIKPPCRWRSRATASTKSMPRPARSRCFSPA